MVSLILCILAASAQPGDISQERTDTSDWFPFTIRWDDVTPVPALMMGQFHDPPAGKYGFVEERDGHLYFPNGKRARFWGVTLAGKAAFPTHEQAEIIAARLVKCGINVVRLHALDTRIYDPDFDDSRHLSSDKVDRLDYLVAQLKKHGIYIFMDWCSHAWRAREGDNLDQRSAYHWAMLDGRFAELLQHYARVLFLHTNPYTGNRYVDEPAIVVFEIVNELDIFGSRLDRVDDSEAAEYRKTLEEHWNRWLLNRYGERDILAAAWTDARAQCGLLDGEDPAKGNVKIPLPAHGLGSWDRDNTKVDGPARASDALLFLYEIQTTYFEQMRDFLRGIGVKVPISGTNWRATIRPLARSNAQLDFTENHGYWDHAQPWGPGRNKLTRTQNMPMVRRDPAVGESTLMGRLAPGRTPGKPFIISEWNFDSPNEYRCEGPIEMAAYGALQDWDGIICYTFYGGWSHSWDEVSDMDTLGMYLGSEELLNDPSLMCQFPIAAAIFLRGDVQAAKYAVDVGYSRIDTFFSQDNWSKVIAQFGFLPFVHRVRYCYFDDEYTGNADIVVSSGLSAFGSYTRARRAILFSDNPSADLHGKSIGRRQLVAGLYPNLQFQDRSETRLSFDASIFPLQEAKLLLEPGLRVDTLPQGALAFGVDQEKQLCLGFMDDTRCIVPGAAVLRSIDDAWLYRLLAAAKKHWGLVTDEPGPMPLVSDTGELSWNSADGFLTINTDRTQGAVGFIGGRRISLRNFELEVSTNHCSVLLTSVDDRPIAESRRLLLTAIARSENTDQFRTENRTTVPAEGRGHAPVLVEPVAGVVAISTDNPCDHAVVQPLDVTGKPKREISIDTGQRKIGFELGKQHSSVHYAIELFMTDR